MLEVRAHGRSRGHRPVVCTLAPGGPHSGAMKYLFALSLLLAAPAGAAAANDLPRVSGPPTAATGAASAFPRSIASIAATSPASRRAWEYSTGEAAVKMIQSVSFEATPLCSAGCSYLSTPLGKVIALDAGDRAGSAGSPISKVLPISFGDFTNRGVSLWTDPRARVGTACAVRVIVATVDARLHRAGRADGQHCAGFGEAGTVDLRRALRNTPFEKEEYEVTSPPAIVAGVIVVGSAVADNNRTDAASGEVRAFDARTGVLRWTWDPVPQDSTDPAWRTWIGTGAHRTGAANAWSVIAADSARGLVFVPTGSASPDYFGGERKGQNLYANSIVALRAATGEVVWHFQTVHHDLWDYDNASPPAAHHDHPERSPDSGGDPDQQDRHAVRARSRDRRPGLPVEERPVPASTVPGEEAWPTQPFTTVIAPLSPHRIAAPTDAWGPTPADQAACRDKLESLRNEGIFTPPSLEGTLVIPSNIGGAHWGGLAVDAARQLAVVPVNRIAAEVQLIPREEYHRACTRPATGSRDPSTPTCAARRT